MLDTVKSHRKLCTVWCRLETLPEEPQHKLISLIHSHVPVTLSSCPHSSHPLIILVAFFCVLHSLNTVLALWTEFWKLLQKVSSLQMRRMQILLMCVGACVLWKGKPELAVVCSHYGNAFYSSWSLRCSVSAETNITCSSRY